MPADPAFQCKVGPQLLQIDWIERSKLQEPVSIHDYSDAPLDWKKGLPPQEAAADLTGTASHSCQLEIKTNEIAPLTEPGIPDLGSLVLGEQNDLSFLAPTEDPLSIGKLDHYLVRRILGSGAFGIVFEAFDTKLHRKVAIKLLKAEMAATSPPRKRFLREARAAAAIRHENVIQVYSVEEKPLPYLAMEYIDGKTLQQKLDEDGPLEPREVLRIGRQIASGLVAAHALGIIHRDIKPDNILLEKGPTERVKISDFGLARVANDASLSKTGVISGTPMYMSPEQAHGATTDARTDIFSLGSLLYVAACGRPPFRASNVHAVLRRVIDDTPRPMREVLSEVPEWLEQLVARLHEKSPDARIQTAAEVVALFSQCEDQLQTHGKVTILGEHYDAAHLAEALPASQPYGSMSRRSMIAGSVGAIGLAAFAALQLRQGAKGPNDQAVQKHDPKVSSVVDSQETYALDFDGIRDYLQIPDLEFTGQPLTVEAWVQPRSEQTGCLVAIGGTKGGFQLYVNHEEVVLSSGSQHSMLDRFKSAENGLHHVAVTFHRDKYSLFLDGKLWTQEQWPPASSFPGLIIGCRPADSEFLGVGDGIDFFDGRLHSFRVSSSVRYSTDFEPVKTLGVDDETTACYQLNQNAETLLDASVHHRNVPRRDVPYTTEALALSHRPSSPRDAERKLIEWTLARGGNVVVAASGGRTYEIQQLSQLPTESYRLVNLSMHPERRGGLDYSLFSSACCLTQCSVERHASPELLRELSKCPLNSLWACESSFSPETMELLSAFRGLRSLFIHETNMSDSGVRFFSGLRNLRVLWMQNTHISDVGLEVICELPSLRELLLSGTGVTDRGLPALSRLPFLHDLELGKCKGVTNSGVVSLPLSNKWNFLSLAETPITDDCVDHIIQMSTLRRLDLGGTAVSDRAVEKLPTLNALEHLNLQGTKNITDACIDHVSLMHPLVVLSIRETAISDASVQKLLKLTNLVTLDITGTKNISEQGIATLKAGLPGCNVITMP